MQKILYLTSVLVQIFSHLCTIVFMSKRKFSTQSINFSMTCRIGYISFVFLTFATLPLVMYQMRKTINYPGVYYFTFSILSPLKHLEIGCYY